MSFNEFRYLGFLIALVAFEAGRISRVEFPDWPQPLHTFETELVYGPKPPKEIKHDVGVCMEIKSPGKYCSWYDGVKK